MKFRKKPVVIDAVFFDGTPAGANEVFDMFSIPGAKFVPSSDLRFGSLEIPTLEGVMTALPNDWIIKGVKGEFYPIKPDIFNETYEADNMPDSYTARIMSLGELALAFKRATTQALSGSPADEKTYVDLMTRYGAALEESEKNND